MAHLATIPDQKTIQGYYSLQASQSSGLPEVKVIPKNLDGSVFDCTGVTTAQFNYVQTFASGPAPGATAMTVGTADATGCVVSMTEAQLNTLCANATQSNNRGTLLLQTASDDFIAAILSINVTTLG